MLVSIPNSPKSFKSCNSFRAKFSYPHRKVTCLQKDIEHVSHIQNSTYTLNIWLSIQAFGGWVSEAIPDP